MAIAATHCSSTAGSQSAWQTRAALGPIRVSNHACRRCLAGHHSWDRAPHVQRWMAISGNGPQRRHIDSISTTIVGRLFSLWAMTCRGWLQSNQSKGSPMPCL